MKVALIWAVLGQGSLVICGGGDLPADVRTEFEHLAGSRIVVIPTATADADDASYIAHLREQWGATVLHTRDPRVASDPRFVAPLRGATGVWITGGDQVRLADAYLGTLVPEALKELYQRGGVIGGTSAGASVMSSLMIRSDVEEGVGFGLLPEAVIDQHFIRRRRMSRLTNSVPRHPGILGLGIDEGTALIVHGDDLRVIGRSSVQTCSARGSRSLKPGDIAKLSLLRSQ